MEFFGTLSTEWALECMKDLLLVNLRGNLQIIVQVYDCKLLQIICDIFLLIVVDLFLCSCVSKDSFWILHSWKMWN